jgi:hypothetical protein
MRTQVSQNEEAFAEFKQLVLTSVLTFSLSMRRLGVLLPSNLCGRGEISFCLHAAHSFFCRRQTRSLHLNWYISTHGMCLLALNSELCASI